MLHQAQVITALRLCWGLCHSDSSVALFYLLAFFGVLSLLDPALTCCTPAMWVASHLMLQRFRGVFGAWLTHAPTLTVWVVQPVLHVRSFPCRVRIVAEPVIL